MILLIQKLLFYFLNWLILIKPKGLIWLFIVRNRWICKQYRIEDCQTFFHRDLFEFKLPFLTKISFQKQHDHLLHLIKNSLLKRKPLSILRFGDGEYFFMKNDHHGNITKRHLTDPNIKIDLEEWFQKSIENDVLTFSPNKSQRLIWGIDKKMDAKWRKFLLKSDIHFTAVYSLVANKNIFKQFKNYKIGLIGASQKIKIIKKLATSQKYLDYLKLYRPFYNYIEIPQKGACNDTDFLFKKIKKQINSNPCDIYLVAIGISKLKILSQIRDYTGAIVIDIGHAMDGLAGIVPKDRQYFGDWINYRIEGYDYSSVDILSQYMSKDMMDQFPLRDDVYLSICNKG